MAGELVLTVMGNLTADPKFTHNEGKAAVTNLTVAQSARVFDRQSGQWRDGDAVFKRCVVFGDMAEHVRDSLSKGTRVIVSGRLRQRSYQDPRTKETKWIEEVLVDDIATSLKYTTAAVGYVAADAEGEEPAADDAVQAEAPGELVGAGSQHVPF
ncbi:single-strand DNA-binding protein [Nocardia tenerifensis]|uniref:Single-stranded DNA-binding protein n=1 Tax=Nocardia tenerifensis TaxID=228006 RepID=A0A318JNT2_9NOCA|nr:single-stranded DNA-binding protein [Nocardia tenerifensis]PXX53431.1 single-strand DNA-binding protein [Nocardia tenerifensis]